MAYEVDLNDKRLVEIQDKENVALTENEKTYNDAISGVDEKYNALIENSKKWAEEQQKNQQAQTDFAIEQINQQKEQTKKDYIKEQSGAFVDYQKEKDSYGVGAEQRAAAGLAGSGYSESAQVSIYNTYQNRVATAREALVRANLNYDNAIQEARLQNNSILAEIAYNALQEQLELSLQGFQYKNSLILEKANKKLEIQSMYSSQYMQMYDKLFQEQQFKFSQDQAKKEQDYKNAQLQLERDKFNYQKSQDAAQKVVSTKGGSGKISAKNTPTAGKNGSLIKATLANGTPGGMESNAVTYLNALIASGATKDKVSNEISLARKNGAITAKQALELLNKFSPRGLQY